MGVKSSTQITWFVKTGQANGTLNNRSSGNGGRLVLLTFELVGVLWYFGWKFDFWMFGLIGVRMGHSHRHCTWPQNLNHPLYNTFNFCAFYRLFHTRLTHISSLCDPVTGSQINSVLESCAHRLVESMEDPAITALPRTATAAAATATATVSQVRLLLEKQS